MTNRYDPHNDHSIFMSRHDFRETSNTLAKICVNSKHYRCLETIINFMTKFDLLDEHNFWSILHGAVEADDYLVLNIMLPDDLNLFTPDKFYKIIKHHLWMSVIKGNFQMFDYFINHPAGPKKHTSATFVYMAVKQKDAKMIVKTIETYDLETQGEIKEPKCIKLHAASQKLPKDLKLYVESFLKLFTSV
jgi:hypothetical protein